MASQNNKYIPREGTVSPSRSQSCRTKIRTVSKLGRKNSFKPKSAKRKACASNRRSRTKSQNFEEKTVEVETPNKTIFLGSCTTDVVTTPPSDTETCGNDSPEKNPFPDIEKKPKGCFKPLALDQNKKSKRKPCTSASRSCSSDGRKSKKQKIKTPSQSPSIDPYESNSRPCHSKRVGPPTKPPNAFVLFFQDYLKEKRKVKSCLRSSEVAKEASEAWSKLSKEKKDCYKAKYCNQLKNMEEESKKK